RIAGDAATTVVSGDYKLAPDPTCTPFEPVRCEVFVTESTFGLPIFRWDEPDATMRAIAAWWNNNRSAGEASVLFAYALGKAQRSAWMRRFERSRTAFASGWMAIRGTRRRRNLDRGFVLSDHADWPAVNAAIEACDASDIRVTHGYSGELVRWLTEGGRRATR